MRRRAFLTAFAASALAPLLTRSGPTGLGVHLGGRARAQAAGPAKRLVIFFSPNGVVPNRYWPTGEGANFTFAPGSVLEPLTEVSKRLLILNGLDFKNVSNHEAGMEAMLTGGGADTPSQGQSVDQYIAGRLPADTPFPSLELGVETDAWGGGKQTRMLYAPGHTFVHPDQDPVSVYKRLFGDPNASSAEIDAGLRKKLSVLDVMRGELADLRHRVGTEEHQKLDAHLDALRRVENGLSGHVTQNATAGCLAPAVPTQVDCNAHENFAAITRSQTDLLVSALGCGMTRVATLQLSHTVGPHVFSWLDLSEGHHTLSHSDDGNATGVEQYVKAERWIAEQFLYLLTQLDAMPEPMGEGTMLDNTLVVWAKELADGRLHNCESVPFILSGTKGYLKTGQHLKLAAEPHQKLLVSICHALGVEAETFGTPTLGAGPLQGLV
jgi:hypothetical protein